MGSSCYLSLGLEKMEKMEWINKKLHYAVCGLLGHKPSNPEMLNIYLVIGLGDMYVW